MIASLPDKLAAMAQVGDEWALNELLAYHKRMIQQMTGRFMGVAQSMTKEDLEQEVTIAVMRCLETWKPGAGSSFFSYAYAFAPHKVTQMMGYIDGPVRIPSVAGLKMRKEFRETGQPNRPMAVSMYKPGLPDGEGEEVLIDEIEALNTEVDHEQRDLVRFAVRQLKRLTPSEAEVVRMLTLEDMDKAEVAAALGCSRQHVSATYQRSVRKLREMVKDRGIV